MENNDEGLKRRKGPKGPKQTEPELYPGHAADLARKARRDAVVSAANAEVLPGALLDVFGHIPEVIAGLRVRPLVHYDFVLLKKIGSPLLEQLKKAAGSSGETTEFSDEQGYEMIWLLTHPVKEAAELIAFDKMAFRQVAVEQIGMKIAPVDIAFLIAAVQAEFVRSFSAAVKYGAPAQAAEDGTVFTTPPAGALTTASVGGSTTCAG